MQHLLRCKRKVVLRLYSGFGMRQQSVYFSEKDNSNNSNFVFNIDNPNNKTANTTSNTFKKENNIPVNMVSTKFKDFKSNLALFAFGCAFFYFLWKKYKAKTSLIELQDTNIYKSNTEILNNNQRIITPEKLIKLLKNQNRYNLFVDVKYDSSSSEPNFHYLKLLEFAKLRQINLRYAQCNFSNISNTELEQIKSLLQIEDKTNHLSYIIFDEESFPNGFTYELENLELAKKFLVGIPKVNNINLLKQNIENVSPESIHIIIPYNKHNKENIARNAVRKYFYENSYLFSDNTINFIQVAGLLEKYLFSFSNTNNKSMSEIIILKDISGINELKLEKLMASDNNDIFYLNEENSSIDMIANNDELISQLKSKEYVTSGRSFIIGTKLNLQNINNTHNTKNTKPPDNKFNLIFNSFCNILELNIDPLGLKLRNSELYKTLITNNKLLELLSNNYYETNLIDKALYFKNTFFNDNKKLLLIFHDSQESMNPDFKTNLHKVINTAIDKLPEDSLQNLRILITNNIQVTKVFNIIPGIKDLVTIRYIDYDNLVAYNDDKYSLIPKANYSNTDKDKLDTSKLFILKYKYNEEFFNIDSLHNFITSSMANKNLVPYLESQKFINREINEMNESKDSIIYLDGDSFKEEIINKKGKKIILGVSENCVGCVKVKNTLRKYLENENSNNHISSNKIKVYEYDRCNETPYARKFKKVPNLLLYQDDQLIVEVDVYSILQEASSENNNYEDKIFSILKGFSNKYL